MTLDDEFRNALSESIIDMNDRLSYIPSYILETANRYLNPTERDWKTGFLSGASKLRKDRWREFNFKGIRGHKRLLSYSGIYVIIQKRHRRKPKVLYIGQSKNVYFRLLSHFKSKRFDRFAPVLVVKTRKERKNLERLILEAKLIDKLKPKENRRQIK